MSLMSTRYTLSSYEPVAFTSLVRYATANDVQSSMIEMAAEQDGTESDMKSLSWVRKNLGYDSMPAFTAAARRKVEIAYEEDAEAARGAQAMVELAKRLQEEPDEELFKLMRESSAIQLKLQLDMARMSLKVFMGRNNLTMDQLNEMLDNQALDFARQQAALLAYADEKGIETPDESEWNKWLGMPQDMEKGLIEKAKRDGKYESYALAARCAKTLAEVVREADVTVIHETAEQAREREAKQNQA